MSRDEIVEKERVEECEYRKSASKKERVVGVHVEKID